MRRYTDSTVFRTNWVNLAYRQLSISDLASRALDGDAEAFVALICRKYPIVVAASRAVLDQSPVVEDVVQEVFVELWRQRTKIKTHEALDGWLVRTARNIALRHLSRETKRRTISEGLLQRSIAEQLESDGPGQAAIRNETVAVVQKVIAELTNADQQVLRAEEQAESDSVAADSLGLKLPAYRVRLHRARRRLRDLLIKYGIVPAAGFALFQGERKTRAAALLAALWMSTSWRVKVAGLTLLMMTCAAAGTIWYRSTPQPSPQPVVVATARLETLQQRNLRLMTDDLADQLLEIIRRFYPPDIPVRLAGIRTFGSIIEVTFQTERPPPRASGLPTRLRGRYCTYRQRLFVDGQASIFDRWNPIQIDKPLILKVPLPFGGFVEIERGHAEFAASSRLFRRMPPDDRAESELIRHLFGPPGAELRIPENRAGATGFDDKIIIATDGSLFIREQDNRWKYAGECVGWFPVVANDRVYCTMSGMIRSRPLNDLNAPWDVVCPEPPISKPEKAEQLFIVGDQLCQVVRTDCHASRPLNDPTAEWRRSGIEKHLHPSGFAVIGHFLFSHDGESTYSRQAADPRAPWNRAAPLPPACTWLLKYRDQLLALGGVGPIYARPATSAPDAPWEIIGQVHSPKQ